MLGGEEHQVAPLVCAMTGWIAREARRLAAFCPGGRLDPPLSLRLDEAALICPIPLHQWTADMGGRGVSIVACFQSRAQVIDRYGDAKTATIINNSGARVLFGGTGDRDDLTYWSTLAGERDEPITTTDLHGRVASRTTRRVPVLAPAQLATLPPGSGGRVHLHDPAGRRAGRAGVPPLRRARPPHPAGVERPRPHLAHAHGRPLAAPHGRPCRRRARPGSTAGVQLGARAARNVDWAPAWVLAVVGGIAGTILGLGLREPARRRVAPLAPTRRRLAERPAASPARRRLTAWWSTARRWRAGRRARVDYQPFPQHAPALTRGGSGPRRAACPALPAVRRPRCLTRRTATTRCRPWCGISPAPSSAPSASCRRSTSRSGS